MRVEWNNCFLCLNDLGGDGGNRSNLGKSRMLLVLNYLLGTNLSGKNSDSNKCTEVLEALKSLLEDGPLDGGDGGKGLGICERCEVDVMKVSQLHQQLEVIQMRLLDLLKGLRKVVRGSSGGVFLGYFEEWLERQTDQELVATQRRILEGIRGFQEMVIQNDKNFVDIPCVLLDNFSSNRRKSTLRKPETVPDPIRSIVKTETIEVMDMPEDDFIDFDAPTSPPPVADDLLDDLLLSQNNAEVPVPQKKRKYNKKKKNEPPVKPEVKDEERLSGRGCRSSSFVASQRISAITRVSKKPRDKDNPKKKRYQKLKNVPKAFTLRSHIIRGGTKTKTYYVCRSCPMKTSVLYRFENHLRDHDEDLGKPPEEKEGNTDSNPKSEPNEPLPVPVPPTELIQCQECDKTFRLQQYFEFHMAGHTGSHEIFCDVCQERCSPFEIADHLKTHTEKIMPCPNCSFCFTIREKYIDHLKYHTTPRCLHPCDLCGNVFKQRRKLLAHYDQDHPGTLEKLFCGLDGCEESFVCHELLGEHRRGHNQHHECTYCGKVLKTPTSLDIHLRQHSNKKPFKCTQCPEAFISKANLDRHMINQHGAPKHKCDICGKEYRDKPTLKGHLRLHFGTALACPTCGKMCMTEQLLERHKLTHSEEKSVVCQICGARFKDQGWIKKHMLIHKGDKQFKCQYCEKSFVLYEYLEQHERIHTGEKPYVCESCGRAFNQYAGLYMHKRNCSAGMFPLSRKKPVTKRTQAEVKEELNLNDPLSM